MISNHKRLLRSIEVAAVFSGPLALLLGYLAQSGVMAPQLLSVIVLPEMVVVLVVSAVAIGLAAEYTRIARAQQSFWERSRGLNLKEIQALVTWCPIWLKYSSLALMVVVIAVIYPGGRVAWGPGEPFEARHLALVIGPTLFIFLSLPVIASARRMPGSYAEVPSRVPPHDG